MISKSLSPAAYEARGGGPLLGGAARRRKLATRGREWKFVGVNWVIPRSPGTCQVSNVGEVTVDGGDIEEAKAIGGDPWVELVESTTFGSSAFRSYILGFFRPE